jgi:hypothetical protein
VVCYKGIGLAGRRVGHAFCGSGTYLVVLERAIFLVSLGVGSKDGMVHGNFYSTTISAQASPN